MFCLQSIVGPAAGTDADGVSHADDTLTSEDPKRITTVVFYSITSTQRGLNVLLQYELFSMFMR